MDITKQPLMPAQTPAVDLADYIHAEPVVPMKMTMQCPGCLKGELIATGMSNPMSPPIYQHRCKCGHELGIVGKSYPHIAFEKMAMEKNDDEPMVEQDGVLGRFGDEGGGGVRSGSGSGGDTVAEGRRAEDGCSGGTQHEADDGSAPRPLPGEYPVADPQP